MRHTKILSLLAAVGAAVLMVLAGSASATTVTSPTGTAVTPTTPIHFVSETDANPNTKHLLLHNAIASIECESTIEFNIDDQGAGVTATGAVDSLTFAPCTAGWTFEVKAKGSLEIHWTSSYNGTVTWSGFTAAMVRHTIFGTVTCNYKTNATPHRDRHRREPGDTETNGLDPAPCRQQWSLRLG